MIKSENKLVVRYDEVDMMGFVYHGNYAKYYHLSRTGLLRKIGINDKTLESQKIIMPVIEINIKYIKPVFYDEEVRIVTQLETVSGAKLKFDHLIYNQKNKIVNKANSTLVFVDSDTLKPIRIPTKELEKIESYRNNKMN